MHHPMPPLGLKPLLQDRSGSWHDDSLQFVCFIWRVYRHRERQMDETRLRKQFRVELTPRLNKDCRGNIYFLKKKNGYKLRYQSSHFSPQPGGKLRLSEFIPQIPVGSAGESLHRFIWHDWHYLLPLATSMWLTCDPWATMLFETTLSSMV